MPTAKKALSPLKKVNKILAKRYAKMLQNLATYASIQCRYCGSNFYLDFVFATETFREPRLKEARIDYGIISDSDAYGIVQGYKFRFPCPHCGTLLRLDEDEIKLRAYAKPDNQHF